LASICCIGICIPVRDFGLRGRGCGKTRKVEKFGKHSFMHSEKKNSGYTKMGAGALFVPWAMLYNMGSNWI